MATLYDDYDGERLPLGMEVNSEWLRINEFCSFEALPDNLTMPVLVVIDQFGNLVTTLN